MSGPALRKVDSHSAIHEAALLEAEELTDLVEELLAKEEVDKAKEVSFILVEHWESRTLQHAKSEEEGLYKEVVKDKPELHDEIVALTRDHDLLRELVEDVKDLLDENRLDDSVKRFQSLILIDLLHNKKEMEILPEH